MEVEIVGTVYLIPSHAYNGACDMEWKVAGSWTTIDEVLIYLPIREVHWIERVLFVAKQIYKKVDDMGHP